MIKDWKKKFDEEWTSFWTKTGSLRISPDKIKEFFDKIIIEEKAKAWRKGFRYALNKTNNIACSEECLTVKNLKEKLNDLGRIL